MNSEALYGTLLHDNFPPETQNFSVRFSGTAGPNGAKSFFGLNNNILSKHVLLVGSTGTGKTNLFYHIVKQLKSKMSPEDVMLIFDSKGDFYSKFFSVGDVVIGSSAAYRTKSARWSIYNEVPADGFDRVSVSQNIREICKSLFASRLEKNNNPFFPNAAVDVLAALMLSLIREGIHFTNSDIKEILDTKSPKELNEIFSHHKDLRSVSTYLDPKGGAQSLGVLGEVYSVIRDVLTGVFSEAGDFSMRQFIRARKAKTAFIEYDLSIGDVLAPVYTLLFDLALKEALGRSSAKGNVYLIADELKLLPNLRHLEDGINFGRSLGVKILAGLQSIDQLDANYDKEAKARNAISGFSTVIAFRSSDFNTREYISNLFGKNVSLETFEEADGTVRYDKREGFIVEDWDLLSLKTGEAVVGLPEFTPFKFKFEEFK